MCHQLTTLSLAGPLLPMFSVTLRGRWLIVICQSNMIEGHYFAHAPITAEMVHFRPILEEGEDDDDDDCCNKLRLLRRLWPSTGTPQWQ